MTVIHSQVQTALSRFSNVLFSANFRCNLSDLEVRVQGAPHDRPTRMPSRSMAVYGFFEGESWLQIGRAGPNSGMRFCYQHYKPGSAPSTLGARLLSNEDYSRRLGLNPDVEDWMQRHLGRMDILVPLDRGRFFLTFLESFLQMTFQPKFEGRRWVS